MITGLPEPWGSVMNAVVGPFGVIVVQSVAIYFLWRLFRESTAEARKAQDNVGLLTQAIKDLTTEVRAWRETVAR